MGYNPSYFQSFNRPVESILFKDVLRFLNKINTLVPNLHLTLPSEAQWEYACRAGTRTTTYAGTIKKSNRNHESMLDRIAWYAGNSGVNFGLNYGFNPDGRLKIDEEYINTGTHPVKKKEPNAWGLYDMLGNVWEWCADNWHDNYEYAPNDGRIWLDTHLLLDNTARHVIRGGSWRYDTQFIRAAHRSNDGPSARNVYCGFRCGRFQI